MKFLIFFMITFNVFANYIDESKVGSCEDGLTVYLSPKENTIKIPKNYNCETHKLAKKKIKDMDSPIWGTRSMVSSCDGEQDCQEKRDELSCSNERVSFVNAEFTEIWCNKIVDYNMIETDEDVIIVDEEKKSMYDAKMLKKKNKEIKIKKGQLNRAACEKALAYLSGINDEKPESEVDAMTNAFSPIYDALNKKRRKKALRLIKANSNEGYQDLKQALISILE